MAAPPVEYPDTLLLLPPRFMGSIGYYATLARYGHVVVDVAMRYDKRQKAVHRCDIVDTRGIVQLTVPVSKPAMSDEDEVPTWCHCPVSTHDEWWRQMRITLESAYGRTPYFEFLIDKFNTILRSPEAWDFRPNAMVIDCYADRIIRGILGLANDVEWCGSECTGDFTDVVDMRRSSFVIERQPEYWQVRRDRLGFRPNLSILDLIFNLGPEASIYLKQIF